MLYYKFFLFIKLERTNFHVFLTSVDDNSLYEIYLDTLCWVIVLGSHSGNSKILRISGLEKRKCVSIKSQKNIKNQ